MRRLSEAEEKILDHVVGRFDRSNESTERKDLAYQFRSPSTIDRLIDLGLLMKLDNGDRVAPLALGVARSSDRDALVRAASNFELVLRALQNLYFKTPLRLQVYRNTIIKEVDELNGQTSPAVVDRGLYFLKELPILDSYGPAPGPSNPGKLFNIEWTVIAEKIVEIDPSRAWTDHVTHRSQVLEQRAANTNPPSTLVSGDKPIAEYKFMRMAVEEARKSVAEADGRTHPRVGAVVVKDGQVLSVAHRGEAIGSHAEYIAMDMKLPETALAGATVYTTLEPCTTRNHPKIPCASRLVQRKVARVVIGMLDPDPRICGKGQRYLRKANIITELFRHDLMSEVEEMNREFIAYCDQDQRDHESVPSQPALDPAGPTETGGTPSERERIAGRRWVEDEIREILVQRGLRLESAIEWTPDVDREMYTLTMNIGGHQKHWRLSYESLEDCVADRNVQHTIRHSLSMFFVPTGN